MYRAINAKQVEPEEKPHLLRPIDTAEVLLKPVGTTQGPLRPVDTICRTIAPGRPPENREGDKVVLFKQNFLQDFRCKNFYYISGKICAVAEKKHLNKAVVHFFCFKTLYQLIYVW